MYKRSNALKASPGFEIAGTRAHQILQAVIDTVEGFR